MSASPQQTARPKFTVKLKSDTPKVQYTQEDVARDWERTQQMLKHLLLSGVSCCLRKENSLGAPCQSHASSGGDTSHTTEVEKEEPTSDVPLGKWDWSHVFAVSEEEDEGGRPNSSNNNSGGTNGVVNNSSSAAPTAAAASGDGSQQHARQPSCEEAATACRNLTRNGHAQRLYSDGLLLLLNRFVRGCMVWLRRTTHFEPVLTVRSLTFLWESLSLSLQYLSAVFADLGQGYIMQHVPERSIVGVGRKLYCDALKSMYHGEIAESLIAGVLQMLQSDRDGLTVHKEPLATAARVIAVEANLYFSSLEPQVVKATMEYYDREVNRLRFVDCVEGDTFFATVHRRINEEKHRVASYLDPKSKSTMEECVQKALLEVHGPSMLAASFDALAERNDFDSIRLAWRLLRLKFVAKGDSARGCFHDYIVRKGTSILSPTTPVAAAAASTGGSGSPSAAGGGSAAPEDTGATIAQLVQLYRKSLETVKRAFDSMDAFLLTLREAMQAAVRPREQQTAEALAKYLDSYLREGVRRETDAEVEDAISAAMKLFAFIPAKDIFEGFYADLLAKRLIYQRVRSMDLERLVISRVKDVVGTTSSAKLEGMLKDIATNEDLQRDFAAFAAATMVTGTGGADAVMDGDGMLATASTTSFRSQDAQFSYAYTDGDSFSPATVAEDAAPIERATAASTGEQQETDKVLPGLRQALSSIESAFLVLTVGYWPSLPRLPASLPESLQRITNHFAQFYSGRHSGRRLTWTPALSTCVIRAQFNLKTPGSAAGSKKEITMSLLQGLILLAFDDAAARRGGTSCGTGTSGVVLTYEQIAQALFPPSQETCAAAANSAATTAPQQQQQQQQLTVSRNASHVPTTVAEYMAHPEVICAMLGICGVPSQRFLLRASGKTTMAIDPQEQFSVNDAFTCAKIKFRVNQVQLRDPKHDAAVVKERAFLERTYVVDAAIVRYLKSRRRANHVDLVNDVTAMLKFPASSADIKRRVEVLIERDYLRRDANDASTYEYLA